MRARVCARSAGKQKDYQKEGGGLGEEAGISRNISSPEVTLNRMLERLSVNRGSSSLICLLSAVQKHEKYHILRNPNAEMAALLNGAALLARTSSKV